MTPQRRDMPLKELPGRAEYQDFAVEVDAQLPPTARELTAERAELQAQPLPGSLR